MAKGHKHSAREHKVYNDIIGSYAKRGKPITEGHAWAIVEGMSPKTLHKVAFKTTPRQYSITQQRSIAARRVKSWKRSR